MVKYKREMLLRDLIKIELKSLDKETMENINIFHMSMHNNY